MFYRHARGRCVLRLPDVARDRVRQIAETTTKDLYLVEEVERFETRASMLLCRPSPNDTIVTITATPTMTPIVGIARSFACAGYATRDEECQKSSLLSQIHQLDSSISRPISETPGHDFSTRRPQRVCGHSIRHNPSTSAYPRRAVESPAASLQSPNTQTASNGSLRSCCRFSFNFNNPAR